jgi:hypothetical protein
MPKNVEAAMKLKERTLTNLYNLRPRWLADAHDALDRAVASAYGWTEDISTEDALQRLLALNLERAAAQGNVVGRVAENGPSSPLPAPSRGEILWGGRRE